MATVQHQDTDEVTRPDTTPDSGHRVVLEMPAAPEYVALSRLTIAALANRFDLDTEVVADLKLVVTEACSLFLDERRPATDPRTLRIVFQVDDDRWAVTVEGPAAERGPGGADEQSALALVVIEALTDGLETHTEGPLARVTFTRSVR